MNGDSLTPVLLQSYQLLKQLLADHPLPPGWQLNWYDYQYPGLRRGYYVSLVLKDKHQVAQSATTLASLSQCEGFYLTGGATVRFDSGRENCVIVDRPESDWLEVTLELFDSLVENIPKTIEWHASTHT